MLAFIKLLKDGAISVWVEGEDLKVAYDPKVLDKNLIDKLREKKSDVVEFLKLNNIYTKDEFVSRTIFKCFNTNIPLSFSQEGLFFIECLDQGVDAYHIPCLFELDKDVDFNVIEQSINFVAKRHSVLKTFFKSDVKGNYYQKESSSGVEFKFVHCNSIESFQSDLQNEISRPFDLVNDIPIRSYVYQVHDHIYLHVIFHHIAFDGWSRQIFMSEFVQAYKCLAVSLAVDLPELDINYGDYSAWQRQSLTNGVFDKQLQYWRQQLENLESLQLPCDHGRPARIDYRGDDVSINFTKEMADSLKVLARQQETTLYNILLTAFSVCLANLSGQNDIVIGTPSDNRNHQQTQALIGLFVNSLVLRTKINPQDSIADFIHNNHQVILHAKMNQDIPLKKLVDLLAIEPDVSRHPVFQVMFSLDKVADMASSNAILKPVDHEIHGDYYNPAKFDLSLIISDSEEKTSACFNYCVALFDKSTIVRLSKLYLRVLSAFTQDVNQAIGNIDLLSDEDRFTLVEQWNQDGPDYGPAKTLPKLFERQAERVSTKAAIVFDDNQGGRQQLSYAELNTRANCLSALIALDYTAARGENIKPGMLVGLYFERSVEMIVAILAVLKVGAAYVPISPDYPDARTQYLVTDAQLPIILCQLQHSEKLSHCLQSLSHNPILLDCDIDRALEQFSGDNLASAAVPDDIAYVIYTSGTTGKPKGVMQPHKNVQRLFSACQDQYQFSEADNWVLFHAYTFDFSVWELWGALIYGGTLLIPADRCVRSSADLIDLCDRHKVTVLNQTPAAFYAFAASAIVAAEKLVKLRLIIFGGDKLSLDKLRPWWRKFGDVTPKLVNMYGITETTVHVTYQELDSNMNIAGSNIGRPLADMKAYILDQQGNLAAMGAIGELYIGGAGLASGYLNRRELTEQRFLDNPFASDADIAKGYTRFYKTGDLARWLTDGNLDYIGRNDNQVKVRGYRIELGEIESVLLQNDTVSQAVVVAVEGANGKNLAAYIVTTAGIINEGKLRQYCTAKLPEYILPNYFIGIEKIPLTLNGKLDLSKLPKPELVNNDLYVAPSSGLETDLCAIWQEILCLERVGINDNFFRIGGDSISAIRLTSLSRERLGFDIPLASLFEHKCISSLAASFTPSVRQDIPKVNTDRAPLSYAQERLLFIERYEPGTSLYHMPYMMRLDADTNLEMLRAAFDITIGRHAALKSVCVRDDKGSDYLQISTKDIELSTQQVNGKLALQDAVKADIDKVFNLDDDLPIRLHCYQSSSQNYLLILFHHIAFDGWSEGIFFKDLGDAYQALLAGVEVSSDNSVITYSDYSNWQRSEFHQQLLQEQTSYWLQALSGFETLALPYDFSRPAQIQYQGDDYRFTIDADTSEQLRVMAKENETTLYVILLAGFFLTLERLSSQTDIVIGTPTDNRQHAQTQGVVGYFGNTLPLRAQLNSDSKLTSFIALIHEVVSQARIFQELPFEQLVDALKVDRDVSRHPIFQTMFTLMGSAGDSQDSLPFQPVDLDSEGALFSPAKFDLSLFLRDTDTGLMATFNYATALFEMASIVRFSSIYKCILAQFVSGSDHKLADINTLSAAELNHYLHKWSYSALTEPEALPIHTLFEAQVAQHPKAIAVIFDGQELSYQQLNIQANRLANVIRNKYLLKHEKPLQPDTLIALYLQRDINMIVSILAVLKSGAAYIPIEVDIPDERCRYIFSDARPEFVLCQSDNAAGVSALLASSGQSTAGVISVDCPEQVSRVNGDNLGVISKCSSLAYVIYTSGTTGQPKGVMIEQGTYSKFCQIFKSRINSDSKSISFLSMTNYSFDMFCSEYPLPLISGGKLILSTAQQAVDDIRRYAADIDIIQQTPSLWELLIEELLGDLSLSHIQVSIGGESGSAILFDKLYQTFARVYQAYGPTEACVWSSISEYQPGLDKNIGKPLNSEVIYLLDKQMQPTAVGVSGEIYIGGIGLARGYLNNPDLTRQKFIHNPFSHYYSHTSFDRLYKTGDLARRTLDGSIEYIGRNDFQVKINGKRIELGEIEVAISDMSSHGKSVVVVEEYGGRKCILAYIVANSNDLATLDKINQQLSLLLPDYMLLDGCAYLSKIPLNTNGKLDKKQLPRIDIVDEVSYQPPKNELQAKLCSLWQDVLSIERVGIDDNFFRIGGHSLNAVKLVSRSESENIYFTVKQLYESKTVLALSESIYADKENDVFSNLINKSINKGRVPAGYLVQNWWRETNQGVTGSVVVGASVVTIAKNINKTVLMSCLSYLYARHGVLRTLIHDDNGDAYLEVLTGMQPVVDWFDLSNSSDLDTEYTKLITEYSDPAMMWNFVPLHQRSEPAAKVFVIKCDDEFHVRFVIDHILADGYALNILSDELSQLLDLCQQGKTLSLAENNYDFIDYVSWLSTDYPGSVLEKNSEVFWQRQASRYKPSRLAHDFKNVSSDTGVYKSTMLLLGKESAIKINNFSRKTGLTKSNVLFSLFNCFVANKLGVDNPSLGIVLSGRTVSGTEKVVGNFADMVFIPSPAKSSNIAASIFSDVSDLVNDASVSLAANYRQYIPPGITPGDKREVVRLESSPFAFSYDAFFDVEDIDGANIDGIIHSRIGSGTLHYIWIRVSNVKDDYLLTVDLEGRYFSESTLLELASSVRLCFSEVIDLMLSSDVGVKLTADNCEAV